MEARVIESIELWFQEAGSEEAVNFIDFMLFMNESAYSLLHRDTLHGIFTYQVRYQDGTSQSVSYDKDEWVAHERNEWQTGMSGGEWVCGSSNDGVLSWSGAVVGTSGRVT